MNIYYLSAFIAISLAVAIVFLNLKKQRHINELLKERQYTKIKSVSWLAAIHISLIVLSLITSYTGLKEKNISMFISSLMIMDLCLFELINFMIDGIVYYSDDYTIISDKKIKNKHIVKINAAGKVIKSAFVVLTNGTTLSIGYKSALQLKARLKK